MLCRVAESLFWMSRYIERAENTVRLVDVTLQTLLESDTETDDISFRHWKPILSSLGDLHLFHKIYDRKDSDAVTDFLLFSEENPSSVFSLITAARENARMIRDQISSEMWAVINRLYLFLKSEETTNLAEENHQEIFERVKETSQLFQGVCDSTYTHRLGYDFIAIGKFIERADKTGRIVDSKHYMVSETSAGQDALAIAQWTALLSGCSALEAYHQVFVAEVTPENTAEFLILSREFPRSVLYSLTHLQMSLHAISKCPLNLYSNEAERLCGSLISRLNYATITEIFEAGLHEFLTEIQTTIYKTAEEINKRYLLSEIIDPVKSEQSQEQSQI